MFYVNMNNVQGNVYFSHVNYFSFLLFKNEIIHLFIIQQTLHRFPPDVGSVVYHPSVLTLFPFQNAGFCQLAITV